MLITKEQFDSLYKWFFNFGWEIFNAASVVAMSSIKFFTEDTPFSIGLFLFFFVLYLFSFYKINRKKTDTYSLINKLDRLTEDKSEFEMLANKFRENTKKLLDSYIKIVYSKLGFSNGYRINVFHHNEDHFSLIARFSSNPRFNNSGKPVYPDNEGYISRGFSRPSFQVNGLPDPETNWNEYRKEVRRTCNINDERLENLTMRSRSYFTLSIDHPVTKERVALVVFESTNPTFTGIPEIIEVQDELSSLIISYLHYTEDVRGDLSFAKRNDL